MRNATSYLIMRWVAYARAYRFYVAKGDTERAKVALANSRSIAVATLVSLATDDRLAQA